jgi:hypothetical protein
MDLDLTPDPMSAHPAGSARRTSSHRVRNLVVGGAAAAGVLLGAAGIAGAATTSDTSSTTAATATAPSDATRPDPATMTNGPGETLLTGTEADQVTAAAKAEIPDGTIIRVETDSSGAGTYEAHVKKADGTTVTLLFDSSFKVTSTVDGFGGGGPGGPGGPGHGGPPPAGQAPAADGSTSTTAGA